MGRNSTTEKQYRYIFCFFTKTKCVQSLFHRLTIDIWLASLPSGSTTFVHECSSENYLTLHETVPLGADCTLRGMPRPDVNSIGQIYVMQMQMQNMKMENYIIWYREALHMSFRVVLQKAYWCQVMQ